MNRDEVQDRETAFSRAADWFRKELAHSFMRAGETLLGATVFFLFYNFIALAPGERLPWQIFVIGFSLAGDLLLLRRLAVRSGRAFYMFLLPGLALLLLLLLWLLAVIVLRLAPGN